MQDVETLKKQIKFCLFDLLISKWFLGLNDKKYVWD